MNAVHKPQQNTAFMTRSIPRHHHTYHQKATEYDVFEKTVTTCTATDHLQLWTRKRREHSTISKHAGIPLKVLLQPGRRQTEMSRLSLLPKDNTLTLWTTACHPDISACCGKTLGKKKKVENNIHGRVISNIHTQEHKSTSNEVLFPWIYVQSRPQMKILTVAYTSISPLKVPLSTDHHSYRSDASGLVWQFQVTPGNEWGM